MNLQTMVDTLQEVSAPGGPDHERLVGIVWPRGTVSEGQSRRPVPAEPLHCAAPALSVAPKWSHEASSLSPASDLGRAWHSVVEKLGDGSREVWV